MSVKEKNSFKELESNSIEQYESNLNKVKKSLDGNLNSIAFVTNIIDVYFSRVISYVVNLSGGEKKEKENEE